MAHKTLINGTAYEVSGGRTLVNGTGYKIGGGRTKVNGTGYKISLGVDPVFANNTWAEIIQACHNNEVPDTWAVGDQKDMTIGGKSYTVNIIGKNHDTYTGGGTAPLTFQLNGLYDGTFTMNNTEVNSNHCSWRDCLVRTTHLPPILAAMPAEVQAGIREVNKFTYRLSTLLTTADKLFLLSQKETYSYYSSTYGDGEGTQYEYYVNKGNDPRKFRYGTTGYGNYYEWLRTPKKNSDWEFVAIRGDNGGATSRYAYATEKHYIAPAFCF